MFIAPPLAYISERQERDVHPHFQGRGPPSSRLMEGKELSVYLTTTS